MIITIKLLPLNKLGINHVYEASPTELPPTELPPTELPPARLMLWGMFS